MITTSATLATPTTISAPNRRLRAGAVGGALLATGAAWSAGHALGVTFQVAPAGPRRPSPSRSCSASPCRPRWQGGSPSPSWSGTPGMRCVSGPRAPAAARALAVALPIPVAAPGTSAVLPVREVDWVMVRPPSGFGVREGRADRAGGPGRPLEPVVEMHLGALTKVGAEPARAAQPSQLASARAWHHEPLAGHDVVLHGARIL
jgi:hypothetical protein